MKAVYPQLRKAKAIGRNHNDQPPSDAFAGPRTAHRRLYVEVTENTLGSNEGGTFPKRLFEQLSDLHVKCTNPNCRDGGIFLSPIIREMLQNEETKQLFVEMCPGRVRLHGHRLGWVRCQKMFCIKVLLA